MNGSFRDSCAIDSNRRDVVSHVKSSRRSVGSREEGKHGWGNEYYHLVNNNDLEMLTKLVDVHKIDLNSKFSNVRNKKHMDLSAIHLVASKGYTGMLTYLHDMGADIHMETSTLRRTALHFAVLKHKVACFHKLLAFGVNVNARDTFGNSACHYAAEDGAIDMLQVLLERRVDFDAEDITLKTPLMRATRNEKIEAVRYLLRAGASLTARDQNCDTALHFAARQGSSLLLNILLKAANENSVNQQSRSHIQRQDQVSLVDLQNKWGHTALLEAVSYNNKDAVTLLLQNNCDVNSRDYRSGDTALHLAVRKNYPSVVEQLLASGRVENKYNYQNELPIFHVVQNSNRDLLRLFLHYNYDLEAPCKWDFDGSGGKSVVRVSLEKSQLSLARTFSKLGLPVSLPFQSVVGIVLPGAPRVECSLEPTQAAVVASFIKTITPVRTLKELCRRSLRKHLSYEIHQKVSKLILPHSLKDFLLLEDIINEDGIFLKDDEDDYMH